MKPNERLRADPAVQFLLASRDPSVRCFTLTDVLGARPNAPEAVAERARIPRGERVKQLLAYPTGTYNATKHAHPSHPYKKWDGAHWRLVSLVELGIPAGHPKACAAVERVLGWLLAGAHRSRIPVLNGRARRCASQEGNAVAVCSRLGMSEDPRVRGLARDLIGWQWHDGGWNCDKHPEANHSSFYESLAPMWGLTEYWRATGDRAARSAAQRAAELFLSHRLFRSSTTGEVINPEWLRLHYPLYWHYDILQALLQLSRLDKKYLRDPRASEALDLIESKRRDDGCWRAEGYHWEPVGKRATNVDVVDWGRARPNEFITLNALRVLKAAGRL